MPYLLRRRHVRVDRREQCRAVGDNLAALNNLQFSDDELQAIENILKS